MKRGRGRKKSASPENEKRRVEFLDYDFLACRIMREFGWSIEYVLSLTFPVFFDLFGLIRRIRMDAAIDEFYTPYGAVKFGGKCAKNLFNGRGSILLSDPSDIRKHDDVTRSMILRANRKLRALMKQRQEALAKNAKED